MKKRWILIGLLSLVLTSCSILPPVSQNNQNAIRVPEMEQTANLASEEQQENASAEQQAEKKQDDQETAGETDNLLVSSKGTDQVDEDPKKDSDDSQSLNRRALFIEYLMDVELGQRRLGIFECGLFETIFYYGLEEYKAGGGILSTAIQDFDLDGEEEMVVVWIEEDDLSESGEYMHHIYMLVYDIVNGQVCMTDQKEISSGIIFNGFDRRTDFFLVNLNGKMHLCIESYSNRDMIDESPSWQFSAHTIQDGKIYESVSELVFYNRDNYIALDRMRRIDFQNPYIREGKYLPHYRLVDIEPGVIKLATFKMKPEYLFIENGADLFLQHHRDYQQDTSIDFLPVLISFNDYSDMATYLNLPRRDGFEYAAMEGM